MRKRLFSMLLSLTVAVSLVPSLALPVMAEAVPAEEQVVTEESVSSEELSESEEISAPEVSEESDQTVVPESAPEDAAADEITAAEDTGAEAAEDDAAFDKDASSEETAARGESGMRQENVTAPADEDLTASSEEEIVKADAAEDVVEDPEAVVGDTGYATIEEAVQAAVDGDEILLKKNIYLNETLVVDRKIILNLNSFRVLPYEILEGSNKDNPLIKIVSGGDLEIQGEGKSEIDGTLGSDPIVIDGGKLTITSGTVSASGETVLLRQNARLVMNGGKIYSQNNTAVKIHYEKSDATLPLVEINDGMVTGPDGIVAMSDLRLVITGGEFVAGTEAGDHTIYLNPSETLNSELSIMGGDFIGAMECGDYKGFISGGRFREVDTKSDYYPKVIYNLPEKYLAEGYAQDLTTAEVYANYDAAVIHNGSDPSYGSVKEAFEKAENGDTIRLMKNVSVDQTLDVDNNRALTLDLGVYTLNESEDFTTSDNALIHINTGAQLTVNGIEGKGILSVSGKSVILTGGTFILNSGAIISKGEGEIDTVKAVNIFGDGRAVINGGSIYAEQDAIYVYADDVSGAFSAEIKGGSVQSGNGHALVVIGEGASADISSNAVLMAAAKDAVSAGLDGTIKVSDDAVVVSTSADGLSLISNAKAEITGGGIGGGANSVSCDKTSDLSISGGQFGGPVICLRETPFITGGTFRLTDAETPLELPLAYIDDLYYQKDDGEVVPDELLPVLSAESAVYDGKDHKPEITLKGTNREKTFEADSVIWKNESGDVVDKLIDVGTYTATAEVRGLKASGNAKFTIKPAKSDDQSDQQSDNQKDSSSSSEDTKKEQTGTDGTALGKGASAAVANIAILTMKKDKDPAGTVFEKLQLKSTKQKNNAVTVSWKKLKGASGYVIYGNKAGAKNKMKKLATVKGNKKTFKKIAGKKIKKGTYYKFIVVALNKNNEVVSSSKMIFVSAAGKAKAGNYKSVTLKVKSGKKYKTAKKAAVKVGKKLKLKASGVMNSKTKKVKKYAKIRFASSNTKVAKVTSKGVIKGVKKGSCYIYAYAQNGVSKRIKITVK